MNIQLASPLPDVAFTRIAALSPLDSEDLAALEAAEGTRRSIRAHREVIAEGQPIGHPEIILSGWAARVRLFRDGRRQIIGVLLPGDVIGLCRQREPIAVATISALTPVTLCPAPRPEREESGLNEAYAVGAALEEHYIFRQIARLGALSAMERIGDFLLEMHERLSAAGLASSDSFALPMTQEALGDLLGLTSVHVNRTLQMMRRDGLLELGGGTARLKDMDRLRRLVDHRPPTVTSRRRG